MVIVLPSMLTVPSCSSKASVMILSRNMLKRVGERRHPCVTPTFFRNQPPMLPVEEDCTGGLVIEMFNDSDRAGDDIILPHGCKLHVNPCRWLS